MQDPRHEISSIITTLTSTRSASELAETISRYFTPDAQFWHPLCRSNSRREILGVYQWYRIMSPQTKSRVLSVIYDETLNILIVEIVQIFHIRYNPFPPGEARLLVALTLRNLNGLHYIARQEDFYHPTDFVALLAPPLVRLAYLWLRAASAASNVCAWMFRMIKFTGGGLEGADISFSELFESVGSVPDSVPDSMPDRDLRAFMVWGTKADDPFDGKINGSERE